MVSHNIHWFRVRCRMAETLHDKIGTKSQTSQRSQFITGHGTSRILTSNRRHERLTILTRNNSLYSTSTTHHLLRKSVSLRLALGFLWQCESICHTGITTKRYTSLGSDTTPNDKRNTSSSPNLIQNNGCLQLEFSNDLIGSSSTNLSLHGVDINGISHIQITNIHLNRQGTRILHGIKENGSNLSSNTYTSILHIWNMGNILSHEPQD
mmetsp:Transcript_12313/g.23074  ORF Transcript_12313/g.23074 Transcript_12313/m.23074 type:complete len:209 (-) Transcript_12313:1220-1846(-)